MYRASSPDEEALVKAARELGIVFARRTPEYVVIDVVSERRGLGEEERGKRERERGRERTDKSSVLMLYGRIRNYFYGSLV